MISRLFGEVSFSPSIPLTDHLWGTAEVETFDLDQDGDLDLIGFEHFGSRVVWWLNDGEGNFEFGQEWLWERDPVASVLGLGDFDGDEGLEALFSSSEDKGYQPGDLILANWTPDGFSDFEVVASLDVDEGFHHSDVVHLNDDGLPDLVEGGKAYVSGLNFLYEVIDDLDYYLDSALVIAQVDDDDLSEAFDIVGDQDIYRYDFSREESVVVSRIATLPDDETLTGIGFHGVSKDILSFSRKHLTEGQGLDLHDEEWEVIVRAHLSDGNADTEGVVVYRSGYIGHRRGYLYLSTDEDSGRVLANRTIYHWEQSRQTSSFVEVVWEDGQYWVDQVLDCDYFLNEARPLFREINGDGVVDLVFPFASRPRVIVSYVDQLSWIPGREDGEWSVEGLRPISTEGLAHEFRYLGDVDGDGDNDFLTQFTEQLVEANRGMVGLWENDGSGNFSLQKIEVDPGQLFSSFSVIKALDVSGSQNWLAEVPGVSNDWPEGRMDFLVGYRSDRDLFGGFGEGLSYVRYLLQDETGKFHFCDVSASDTKSDAMGYQLMDWDRDGSDELIAFSSDSFNSGWQVRIAEFDGVELKEFSVLHPEIHYPHVIDLDQDGFFDLVSSDSYDSDYDSHWFRDTGSDTFLEAESVSFRLFPLGFDLDGDGYDDFRMFHEDGTVSMVPAARNDGEVFVGEQGSSQTGSFDLDGDGDLDRVVSESIDRYTYLRKFVWDETLKIDEGLRLETRRHQVSSGGWRWEPAYTVSRGFGDLDGDGTSDLLFVGDNRIEWFKMTRTVEPAAFSQWMASRDATGHSASPNLDYDLDGRLNWEEFVFGSDPARWDLNSSAYPGIRMGASGVEFSFLFRIDAPDLGIVRESFHSEDLLDWSLITDDPVIMSAEGSYERVSYPIAPGAAKGFYRTNVSPPVSE